MITSGRLAALGVGAASLALILVSGGAGSAPTAGPIVGAPAQTAHVIVDGVGLPASGAAALAALVQQAGAPGYDFLSATIIAETPAGFAVWVDPKAPHHSAIAKMASATVTALRGLGTQIRYRGYGAPASREGLVQVREGKKGCGSNSTTVGVTWTYWNALPSGKNYVTRADVYLCPRLFRLGSWATKATVGHELGHAMGLGHVAYRYLGSFQLMNPIVRSNVLTYRPGDRRGLVRLARQSAAIKTAIPPVGALDDSKFNSNGAIDFRGWALLKYFRGDPVTVQLLDNGRVLRTAGTPVLRTDVNRTQDPGKRRHGYSFSVAWKGGSHKFCLRARSARHPGASAQLGCVTWRG